MEPIRQAVQRAKAAAPPEPHPLPPLRPPVSGTHAAAMPPPSGRAPGVRVELNRLHLEDARIIAHNPMDPRSKAFDILRTQVLQSMDHQNWQLLAVTSPRASCGKSLTAVNLALSIARQPERSVLLVDLDLQKPSLATSLGLNCKHGVVGVLEGRVALLDTIIETKLSDIRMLVLPAETRVVDSSELISSRAMRSMLQDIKREFKNYTVIIDLPPVLAGDDVLALLPQTDCVLLVAGVGSSTVSEIRQCTQHFQSTPMVRLVLNKVAGTEVDHYY